MKSVTPSNSSTVIATANTNPDKAASGEDATSSSAARNQDRAGDSKPKQVPKVQAVDQEGVPAGGDNPENKRDEHGGKKDSTAQATQNSANSVASFMDLRFEIDKTKLSSAQRSLSLFEPALFSAQKSLIPAARLGYP